MAVIFWSSSFFWMACATWAANSSSGARSSAIGRGVPSAANSRTAPTCVDPEPGSGMNSSSCADPGRRPPPLHSAAGARYECPMRKRS